MRYLHLPLESNTSGSGSGNTAAIAGGVVAGIVLVLVVFAAVITALIVCKTRQNKYVLTEILYEMLEVFEWEITCVKILYNNIV